MRQGGESAAVRLGLRAQATQSEVDGFKVRVLRATPTAQRHLYMCGWRSFEVPAAASAAPAPALVVGAGGFGRAVRHEKYWGRAVGAALLTMVVSVAAVRSANDEVRALSVLEAAVVLVQSLVVLAQSQAAREAPPPAVYLLTLGCASGGVQCDAHAGAWGMARSVRAEAELAVRCFDATLALVIESAPLMVTEPEAIFCAGARLVPRLQAVSAPMDSVVRLHFHSRGAISNLFIEPQPALAALRESEVTLRVRAVGLNFRDVLNVLGEYPGDPGPPGADAAGVVCDAGSWATGLHGIGAAVFGLCHASLASVARSAAPLLAMQPHTLSLEQTSTVPVAWSTTHVALGRASMGAGQRLVVQAAAGGVGLTAVEYALWLGVGVVGTAGRPHKHRQLRAVGAVDLCSSRDASGYAAGVLRHLHGLRTHGLLNSLSLDFISASFAAVGEGGCFEEIGKRAIWAAPRRSASARHATYSAIALDADMAHDMMWMHGVLMLLSSRAAAMVAGSLPLRSFDMESQHELAFRTLLSGLNTGKVVVRIAARSAEPRGSHVVTGGTGGLGLLTGRWLAQHGACSLALASRSGTLAREGAAEWDALRKSGAATVVRKCDTAEAAQVRRLVAATRTPRLEGVWHAAGVLVDRLVGKQDASSVCRSYAPKAHGGWLMQLGCAVATLRACALFSSVAALLGGAGQSNYSAANACLDALAVCRRVRGCVGVSVQWGAWAQVGMAARGPASERMAAMEAESGFSRIGLSQGLAALQTAVRVEGPATLSVLIVAWHRVLNGQRTSMVAFLSLLTPAVACACEPRRGMAGAGTCAGTCAVSLETVLEMVRRTAGGKVNADAPLMEAGVDSLGAVELQNQLQAAAGEGMSLPSTMIFDHPTARQLAAVLQPAEPVAAPASGTGTGAMCVGDGRGWSARGARVDGGSALVPGGACSARTLWRLGACGVDAIGEVPSARWDIGPFAL